MSVFGQTLHPILHRVCVGHEKSWSTELRYISSLACCRLGCWLKYLFLTLTACCKETFHTSKLKWFWCDSGICCRRVFYKNKNNRSEPFFVNTIILHLFFSVSCFHALSCQHQTVNNRLTVKAAYYSPYLDLLWHWPQMAIIITTAAGEEVLWVEGVMGAQEVQEIDAPDYSLRP